MRYRVELTRELGMISVSVALEEECVPGHVPPHKAVLEKRASDLLEAEVQKTAGVRVMVEEEDEEDSDGDE